MLRTLLDTLPQRGRLEWIGLRSERRGPVRSVNEAEAQVGLGLLGDHRAARGVVNPKSKRQITLLQAEHLAVIAALLDLETAPPERLRRNLLVSGINLLALRDRTFRVGEVLLEGTGLCHPCSRMEEALGPGGYNVMRGHGGLTARILQGGILHVGDEVGLEPPTADAPLSSE